MIETLFIIGLLFLVTFNAKRWTFNKMKQNCRDTYTPIHGTQGCSYFDDYNDIPQCKVTHCPLLKSTQG